MVILLLILTGVVFFNLHRHEDLLVRNTNRDHFVADLIGPLPESITTKTVRSTTAYIVMAHLVRTLVRNNQNGQIEGDLASAWLIKDGFTCYEFTIDKDAKWSDGSSITAADVERNFRFQIPLGVTTHFDFTTIASVSSDANTFVIHLKKPNPNFLPQMMHPEVGLVHWISKESKYEQDYSISAGPYIFVSKDSKEIKFEKNIFFPWASVASPKYLTITAGAQIEEQILDFKSGKSDFLNPKSGMTSEQFSNLKESRRLQMIDPHIGYTFWLSPNAKSPVFKSRLERLWLAKLVQSTKFDFNKFSPYWTQAQQLYLNDGFGRLTASEVSSLCEEMSLQNTHPPKSFRLLASKNFPFAEDLLEAAKRQGVNAVLVPYTSLEEFESLLNKGDYDAFQINNDFSSPDVIENLSVTFSESRPLVSLGQERAKYMDLLNKALGTQDLELKHSVLKKIGQELIFDGYLVPIAYRHSILFGNEDWDFSRWSLLFPDIRFWKVSLKEKDQK